MKTQLIDNLKEIGKTMYPTPNSKHGFSIRKLAQQFFLNHATLNSWLNGKTSPTERQINQIGEFIEVWKTRHAKENLENYDADYQSLFITYEQKCKVLEEENRQLKDQIHSLTLENKDLEIKFLKKIEKLYDTIEKLKNKSS